MKVLFVCPQAHHVGHPPWAASHETEVLAQAGNEVTLLTACGIRHGCDCKVPELKVYDPHKHPRFSMWHNKLLEHTLTQWLCRIIEVDLVLDKAMRIRKQYDVIHLRDGEPFIFASHLWGTLLKTKWLVSLMGGNVTIPASSKKQRSKKLALYRGVFNFLINNKLWNLAYRAGNRHSQFQYITQDTQTKEHYQPLFGEKITVVPMGSVSEDCRVTQEEARLHLGLPLDKIVLLLFGVPHSGKNHSVVFQAVKEQRDTLLVAAGDHAMSLGESSVALAQKYHLDGQAKIYDYFISEKEKPYYFKAADAVVLSYTRAFSSTSSMLWEACRYQVPVIASNANVLGELVRDNQLGLLFEAENVASLKSSIMNVTALRGNGQFYRDNCQRFAQTNSLEVWAKKVNAIYAKYRK